MVPVNILTATVVAHAAAAFAPKGVPQGPSSFVQTTGSGQAQELGKLQVAVDNHLQDFDAKALTAEVEMSKRANEEMKPINGQVMTIGSTQDALTAQIEQYGDGALGTAGRISDLAGDVQQEVQTAHNNEQTAVKDAKAIIDGGKADTKKEIDGKALADGTDMGNEMASLEQSSNELATSLKESFRDVQTTSEEGFDELHETIDEALDEKKERSSELLSTGNEWKAHLKAIGKEYKGTMKGYEQTIRANEGDVKTFASDIKAEAKTAEQGFEEAEEEVLDQDEDFQKEAEREVKAMNRELEKEEKAEGKELGGMVKDALKDGTSETKELDQAEAEKLAGTGDLTGGTIKFVTTTVKDGEALQDAAETTVDKNKKKLDSLDNTIEAKIRSDKAALLGQQKSFASKLSGQIAKVQDANYGAGQKFMNEATSEVMDTVQGGTEDTQNLGAQVASTAIDIRSQLDANVAMLDSLKQQVDRRQLETDDQVAKINKLQESVHNKGEHLLTEVRDQSTATDEEVKEMLAAQQKHVGDFGKQKEEALVDGIKSGQAMLTQDVHGLLGAAESNIAQTTSSMEQKVAMDHDILTNMQQTSQAVSKLSQDVTEQAPIAKAKAEELIDKVGEGLTEVRGSVGEATKKLEDIISQVRDKASSDVSSDAQTITGELNDDIGVFHEQVEKSVAQSGDIGSQVKKEVGTNNLAAQMHLQETRENLAHFSSEIARIVDKTASELSTANAEASDAKNVLASKARQATREGDQLGATMVANAQSLFSARKKAAEDNMAKLREKQESALDAQEASANADIKQLEQTTLKYMRDKADQMDRSEKMKSDLQAALTKSLNSASDLSKAMDRDQAEVTANEQRILQGTEQDVELGQQRMAAASARLTEQVKQAALQAMQRDAVALNGQNQKFDEAMSAESTKLQLSEAQLRGGSEAFKLNVAGLMAQTQQGIDGIGKNFQAYEDSGKETSKLLNEDLNGLNQRIQMTHDEMKKAEQEGTADTTGLQNKELTVMERLSSGLAQSQNHAKAEVEALGQEFNDELRYSQENAESQIGGVTQELDNMVGSTPDLSADFARDTAATRQQLLDTEKRITASANRTDAVVESLEASLGEVRKRREAQAQEIHEKISELKTDAADKANSGIQRIMEMSRDSKLEMVKIKRHMAEINNKIKNVGQGVTHQHDTAEVERMDKALFKLENEHQRLMTFALNNKHQTAAWRNEVNQQLANVMVSIGADGDEIKNAQVGEEMDLNQALRKMQGKIEDDVRDADITESKFFGNMIGATLGKMENMLGEEASIEAAKEEMSKGAASAMNSGDELVSAELRNVDANDEDLKAKQANLDTNMQVAMREIQDQMLLPRMTASPKNQVAEDKMHYMRSALNSLVGATSFLEDGSAKSEAKSQALSTEDMLRVEQDINQLNHELVGENHKMKAENQHLRQRLDQVKLKNHLQ